MSRKRSNKEIRAFKAKERSGSARTPRTTSTPRSSSGAFTKNGYTLHTMDVKLKGGRMQTIYFFSKKKPKSGTPCKKPEGMTTGVNKRTGLPYLKKGN